MFSKHPKIAKRWAKETRDFKDLPEHAGNVSKSAAAELADEILKGK